VTSRLLSFVGVQLAGGVLGFAAWATLSGISLDAFNLASAALTVGMIVYLPLTLGLIAILPNYFRSGAGMNDAKVGRSVVRLVAIVGLSTSLLGVAISGGGLYTLGTATAFAGLVVTSTALQQVARISLSLPGMGLSALYPSALPLAAMIATSLLSADVEWVAVSVAMFTLCSVLAASAEMRGRSILRAHERETDSDGENPRLADALKIGLPLVPHMLAFAVLTQGLRVPAVVTNNGALLTSATIIMLFFGLALSVIVAFNGFLGVTIQREDDSRVQLLMRRSSWAYAGLGLLGSIALPLAYSLFAVAWFRGAATLGSLGLGLLGAIPPLLCLYFLATTVLLRARRTRTLALVTVPVAVGYVLLSTVTAAENPDVTSQLLVFVLALALAAGLTYALASVATRVEGMLGTRNALKLALGCAPSASLIIASVVA
jgi:hypothetical protein